jgi:hypothetical protein
VIFSPDKEKKKEPKKKRNKYYIFISYVNTTKNSYFNKLGFYLEYLLGICLIQTISLLIYFVKIIASK